MSADTVHMVPVPVDLQGTPVEIGFQLFDQLLQRPLAASARQLPATVMTEIYVGLLIAASSDMALRFDQALAVQHLRDIADQIARHVEDRTPSTTH